MEAATIARVQARYARIGTRFYVRGKLSGDPVCAQVEALARAAGGFASVLDVGCGRGQMGLALLELGLAAQVAGFDWDAEKIEEARSAASTVQDGQARFWRGDTRSEALPDSDAVLLLDVLHYLTADEQIGLVERAARAARRAIVIRELDPDRGWRSAVTRAQEAVTTFARYNVGARVLIRPIAPVVESLHHAGFSVRVEPSWGATPFANVALLATR
jgi:SAM-dependent methyltransferase